jgi:tetratricopeptide (TPR) repeat protein
MKQKHHCFNRDIPELILGCILLTSLISPLSAQTAASEAQIPDNDHSPYHVALLDYKAGHFQEALDALNQGGAIPATDERGAILKSRILTELGKYDEGASLLKPLLTPTGPLEVQLALADLFLRKRDFNDAAKYYGQALAAKPGDPDLLLMMVYTHIGASDLVTAAKIASTLKPLDQANPSYYFARAAIAQSTDKSQEAEDDIETARTMYGITLTNRYLKTYLEVLSAPAQSTLITPTNSPATNAPAAPAKH